LIGNEVRLQKYKVKTFLFGPGEEEAFQTAVISLDRAARPTPVVGTRKGHPYDVEVPLYEKLWKQQKECKTKEEKDYNGYLISRAFNLDFDLFGVALHTESFQTILQLFAVMPPQDSWRPSQAIEKWVGASDRAHSTNYKTKIHYNGLMETNQGILLVTLLLTDMIKCKKYAYVDEYYYKCMMGSPAIVRMVCQTKASTEFFEYVMATISRYLNAEIEILPELLFPVIVATRRNCFFNTRISNLALQSKIRKESIRRSS